MQAATQLAELLERRKQWRAALVLRRAILAHATSSEQIRQARLDLADALVEAGDEAEAIPLLRRMVAEDGSDEPAIFELGTALARQNDFNAALQNFKRAIALRPGDAEAQLSTAKAQVTLLQYEDAGAHLDALDSAGPDAEQIALLRGMVYAHTGRQKQAVEAFQAAARLAPNDPEVQLQLGTALSATGQMTEAVEALTRSAQLRPAVGPWFQLSRVYRILKQPDNERHALAMLQALEEERANDTKVAVLQNQAKAATREGRTPDALATFQQALQLRPGDADLLLQLALVYARLGQQAREEELLLRAVVFRPGFADALAELGKLEVLQNRSAEARLHLNDALRSDPENATALTTLGVLLAREGQTAQAEALLLDAVASDPGSAEAHRDLGLVEAQRGELLAAEQSMRQSLALDATSTASVEALLQVYLAAGRTHDAAALLQSTIDRRPEDAQLRHRLCSLLLAAPAQAGGVPLPCQ